MSDRLPASLAYLLIYNPALTPRNPALREDEDAQEEAQILFYTSRERVASRDRMLRQVGLAKALVEFSEVFTSGQGCDSVHSQGKRMVTISPEPSFWMHVCVDLARTPKQKKDKDKATVSNKDATLSTFYHHEESVHDLALRNCLLKGYEDFKLIHGTYSSMLRHSEPGTLEKNLERFFTPWAWRWDLEEMNNFQTHLGLPVHPLAASLTPLLSSFIQGLPETAIPLLLLPPYIIEHPHSSPAPYPTSLPRYLLSLAPTLHIDEHPKTKKMDDTSKATSRGSMDSNMFSNTMGFISTSTSSMGDVMNVKKWSWPLTFGRSRTASQAKKPDHSVINTLHAQVKSSIFQRNGQSPAESGVSRKEIDAQPVKEVQARLELHDQSALADAIANPAPSLPSQQSEVTPLAENALDTQSSATECSKTSVSSVMDEHLHSPCSPPVQQPGPDFSIVRLYLSETSNPLEIHQRLVLFMSLHELVLALVLDTDGALIDKADEHLRSLANKMTSFLEKIRKNIRSDLSRDRLANNLKNELHRSKQMIHAAQRVVTSNEDFPSTTSSPFFESQELLTKDPEIQEIFSRTVLPQHWFVARRGLGFNKTGDRILGDAYLQINNKEASLVDADNDLQGAVRRWAKTDSTE